MLGGEPAKPATIDDIDHRRCETITGVPISTRDAVIASFMGHVRRVVIDSSGRVIDLGRKRRFTGAARDAVLLDGRRCMWPGCGRASSRNQIDHTHEHARGRSDGGAFERRPCLRPSQPAQVAGLHRASRPPWHLACLPSRRRRAHRACRRLSDEFNGQSGASLPPKPGERLLDERRGGLAMIGGRHRPG